ncbi:copper amine oxidase N-terminal domain-containing protein [Paenibacillus sp. MBLB2552]|uniref:Copper amine oxidase N-terminal domain-containing protein n=1 Tax=Paenibacillus mellifer TaxID=2937794 RepID=A0A9X2BN16_9BACL|nr:copper amine oxidase N-terminal domain-containing protein [Paenibacillus mellifer]MCK8485553.1 copper amine oxidase N-terminal domain-containing protein [Paenibacillus mellifer]
MFVLKKLIFTVAALSMLFHSSAYAAEPMKIRMKNQGDAASIAISSDVKPEVKNNRTMVPLRVISENLGAAVHWSGSKVVLTKNKVEITLEPSSRIAVKDGKTVTLDVKPYLKNNRTMVPLRLIAETFDCKVSYNNAAVTIETKPLIIDGVEVKALQQEYHMTMGGIVNQINGNSYIEAIYNLFIKNKGNKVEAPASYTWMSHPSTGDYYKIGQYDFIDQEGNSIQRFDIYSLVQSSDGDPEVLIYEAKEEQWYTFNYKVSQDIWQFIDTAAKNGLLTEISNTVP